MKHAAAAWPRAGRRLRPGTYGTCRRAPCAGGNRARNVRPGALRGGDQQLARLGRHRAPVEGEGDPLVLPLASSVKGAPPLFHVERGNSRGTCGWPSDRGGNGGTENADGRLLRRPATPGEMLSQRSMRRSRSSSRPAPFSIRYMMRSSHPDPSRQGVHCPHDSREKNFVMRHAARTTQVDESMITTEPEPSMEPAWPDLILPRGRST